MDKINLHASWLQHVEGEFSKEYFISLKKFLLSEKSKNTIIYPPSSLIFAALDACPLNNVKCVILGQDPYHGYGQAHGLSFSVNKGIAVPPSLKNIYKELKTDVGCDIPNDGYLMHWALQGVLLLNTVLTVEANAPRSHAGKGWEQFTTAIIETINRELTHVVFILWGRDAQQKSGLINQEKHLIISSNHPSPFSAHNGFFGSKPFSRANEYLEAHEKGKIHWGF